jgi:hypothetical protein
MATTTLATTTRICAFAGVIHFALMAPAQASSTVAMNSNFTGAVHFAPIAPAQASSAVPMNSNLIALYQIVSGQNQCFVYTYDHNGNRLTRGNLNPGATATWGSSVYGCYNWTTP